MKKQNKRVPFRTVEGKELPELPEDIVWETIVGIQNNSYGGIESSRLIIFKDGKSSKIPVLTKSKSKWIKKNTKVISTKPTCTLTILLESDQDSVYVEESPTGRYLIPNKQRVRIKFDKYKELPSMFDDIRNSLK